MHLIFATLPGTSAWVSAYGEGTPFEKARAVLEVNCVECHTPEKAKGGLIMSTGDDMKTRAE